MPAYLPSKYGGTTAQRHRALSLLGYQPSSWADIMLV